MIDISQLVISLGMQRHGDMVLIRPQLQNPTPMSLRYRLAVRQQSAAGTSSIGQQGELRTGQDPVLVRLSVPAGARCTVHLEVFEQDLLIRTIDEACAPAPD
ncbi:curli-like amyloid fiber formation chaperone CsgH [Pseudomonas sp. dw_358]|uniref:curli-like amyloid fiber formation chaperone CsgH n=1 Tax=Pseudomonas sp. dw_358 TaxID=2720083 RepID=UPI001BD26A95|nr:curli-like amyloid fiber formation chaperone CsgH [Pseudomonas sp. dw_358]